MWEIKSEIVELDRITVYQIYKEGNQLTTIDLIENLGTNSEFRIFYNSILAENSFESFFWENPSIEKGELNKKYEFALIKSNTLNNVKPNPKPFKEYYSTVKNVVVFPNLRGDAKLIVPCPISELENYTHIGKFVRDAPRNQVDEFWREVGLEYKASIGLNRKWLSTAGLGVPWLHLRIDSSPKYYRHQSYKS